MINDPALQLSSVLNIECTKSSVHCSSKKRALEIISELAAKQLNLPSQIVFDAVLTRERMGSTGIGSGIAIPHGKLEEDTLRAVGVFIRWTNLLLSMLLIINRLIYYLPCWFQQINVKLTYTLCL